jgi:hypothetical protein
MDSYNEITIYDHAGCHLNGPEDDLIGRQGYAVYIETIEYPSICPDPNPGNDILDDNNWEIMSLCCVGQECV